MAALAWHDTADWPVEGKGFADTARRFERLPQRAEGVVSDAVWNLSRMSAGLSLRFVTDATAIHVRYDLLLEGLSMAHMAATGHSGVDLYAEDGEGRHRWVGAAQPTGQHVEAMLAEGLRPGRRRCTLYLPLFNSPEKLELGVAEGAVIEPEPARHAPQGPARPLVLYGTSILHGASASRCGMAFPAQLERRLGLPIVNLGFAGNGRMDPEIADLLAGLAPSVYAIDCLPNMTADLVEERTVPCVQRLRQDRPDTPILLVEDRTYANTGFFPAKAERHRASRAALRAAWRQLADAGDPHLHYLAGDALLPADGEATVDSSHPTDLGMVAYADAYERALRPILQTW